MHFSNIIDIWNKLYTYTKEAIEYILNQVYTYSSINDIYYYNTHLLCASNV